MRHGIRINFQLLKCPFMSLEKRNEYVSTQMCSLHTFYDIIRENNLNKYVVEGNRRIDQKDMMWCPISLSKDITESDYFVLFGS